MAADADRIRSVLVCYLRVGAGRSLANRLPSSIIPKEGFGLGVEGRGSLGAAEFSAPLRLPIGALGFFSTG